ncbi:DDT domain-containing protein DDR4-like isoform X2 [Cynara cardunculus var. scolymus]|uniref:DDT domain-containing protein DDR4-like isoform X2 n=1 Tax=Cynara cardunculus var. scolymus TaxID=59895 RepID=UPI000D62BA45|nr:DDT domain-containing protein DDR4-like isoform X2 [Cynara cardunculus var. scolymus]
MSDEPSSSPIHCDGEIKDSNKTAANNNNGSSAVVRRERPSRACTARSAARLYAAAAAEAAVVTDGRKQKSRRRPSRREIEEEEEEEPPPSPPNPYSKIVTPLVREPPLSQLSRWSVRSMWELASILNFLNVFRPLLNIKVDFSVEEFETALITPNATLSDIHIPLLKAIPPVTRMALGKNTWVTVLCRKLRDWWHWVAEGELPIVASHGAEIETYNTLDPGVRVVILKALCDIRVEQEDIRSYIDDCIKHGVPLSAFRKERTGGDSQGVSYWYEDDRDIGQRLYREIRTVEVKKGKGKNVQSVPSYQWETIATNLDEFQDVSEKLSASKNRTEASLGKKLKNDMLPEIEKVHKKKEKLLKKQHRQALLLDSMIVDGFGPGRSLRGRKPVSYTFVNIGFSADEYDRSINEAIKITKRKQLSPEPSVRREGLRHDASETNGTWGGPSQNSHQPSPTPSLPDSLNCDETDEDHASEQLDRSNRKRQRPQRYSTHEFVEAVSDNEADMDSDDDIVGEAVYDEEYLKQRKGRRKMSSSSEGDEEYHWEEENAEEEGDDSLSASEDSDVPQRLKKLRGQTRRETKLRSVVELQSGLRRSKRATRNRIDYTQYEFSESEPELAKPEKSTYEFSESEPELAKTEKSTYEFSESEPELAKPEKSNGSDKNTEASNSPGFSMGSDDTEVNNDNGNDNEEVKMEQPVIKEHQKMEKEEGDNEPSSKIENPVQDEFARKRRFLDLNELAPGSGFEDGPIMKDENTDNV